MGKIRHLLSSIQRVRGMGKLRHLLSTIHGMGRSGDAEGVGKLRHLLPSILLGRVWVSFIICCRRSRWRGRLRHLLWLIKRGRWRSEGWVSFGICYRRSKGEGGEGKVMGKLYHPLTSSSGGEGMGKLRHLLSSIKRGGGGGWAGYG